VCVLPDLDAALYAGSQCYIVRECYIVKVKLIIKLSGSNCDRNIGLIENYDDLVRCCVICFFLCRSVSISIRVRVILFVV
jgi:hypothetical protein